MILTIAHKELRSLFHTPSTWYILGALQLIFAWFFISWLGEFMQMQSQWTDVLNSPGATSNVSLLLFGKYGAFNFILMMLTPIFTMRMIAEERRNQTLPLLMAAPIACHEIVLGKFIGMLLFLALIIFASFCMILTLSLGTQVDFGLLGANFTGLLLLAATYTAIGLFFSALANQPVMAATATLATLFGLWLLDASGSSTSPVLKTLSPTMHFQSFNNGLLQSQDIAWFLLCITVSLLLTIRRMHNARIYGS